MRGGGGGGKGGRLRWGQRQRKTSCPLGNLSTLWNILMILGRSVEQYKTMVSRTKFTTLTFLLLGLSPFVIFDSDYAMISCLLCKSHTLWNIFMILGRNVIQDKTTCHVQE